MSAGSSNVGPRVVLPNVGPRWSAVCPSSVACSRSVGPRCGPSARRDAVSPWNVAPCWNVGTCVAERVSGAGAVVRVAFASSPFGKIARGAPHLSGSRHHHSTKADATTGAPRPSKAHSRGHPQSALRAVPAPFPRPAAPPQQPDQRSAPTPMGDSPRSAEKARPQEDRQMKWVSRVRWLVVDLYTEWRNQRLVSRLLRLDREIRALSLERTRLEQKLFG